MVALADRFFRTADTEEERTARNLRRPQNTYRRFSWQQKNRGPARKNRILSQKYLDQESYLYCFGMRYYHPDLGRWINRDPIGKRGGLNPYAFVGNGPVSGWDKLGLLGPVGTILMCAFEATSENMFNIWDGLDEWVRERVLDRDLAHGCQLSTRNNRPVPCRGCPVIVRLPFVGGDTIGEDFVACMATAGAGEALPDWLEPVTELIDLTEDAEVNLWVQAQACYRCTDDGLRWWTNVQAGITVTSAGETETGSATAVTGDIGTLPRSSSAYNFCCCDCASK